MFHVKHLYIQFGSCRIAGFSARRGLRESSPGRKGRDVAVVVTQHLRRLHLRYREIAVAGATGSSDQLPCASDRIAIHRSVQSQRVTAGIPRRYHKLELARHVAAEVSGEDEGASLGFSRHEAR